MNTFNSDNSNIANIKTQYQEIMTTITNRILKIKPVIKISIVTIIHSLLLLLLATSVLSLNLILL